MRSGQVGSEKVQAWTPPCHSSFSIEALVFHPGACWQPPTPVTSLSPDGAIWIPAPWHEHLPPPPTAPVTNQALPSR
ncbi:hypothetical protein GN956_G24292 [Arapaima gigas]